MQGEVTISGGGFNVRRAVNSFKLIHWIFEVTVHSDGSDILTSMSVSLGTNTSKFSAAIDRASRIYVEGQVGEAVGPPIDRASRMCAEGQAGEYDAWAMLRSRWM